MPPPKTTKLNNGESMTSPGPLSTPVLSLPGVGKLGPVGSLQTQSRDGNTSCQPLAPHSLQLGDTQGLWEGPGPCVAKPACLLGGARDSCGPLNQQINVFRTSVPGFCLTFELSPVKFNGPPSMQRWARLVAGGPKSPLAQIGAKIPSP